MRLFLIALCFATALAADPVQITWTGPPTTAGQCNGCDSNTVAPQVTEWGTSNLTASYFNDALYVGGETVQSFSIPFSISADADIELDATLSYSASFAPNPAGDGGSSGSVNLADSIFVFDSNDNVMFDLPLSGLTTGPLGSDSMGADADLPAGNYTLDAYFNDSIYASGDSQVYAQVALGMSDPTKLGTPVPTPVPTPEPVGESLVVVGILLLLRRR